MYRFRIKKTRLGEISGELKLFNACFMGYLLEKKNQQKLYNSHVKISKMFLNVSSFSSRIDSSVQ